MPVFMRCEQGAECQSAWKMSRLSALNMSRFDGCPAPVAPVEGLRGSRS